MPLLFTDELFLAHDTGHHVESPDRLRAILTALESSPITDRYERSAITPAPDEQSLRVNPDNYIRQIEQFAARGGGWADSDTFVSPQSAKVARTAAGTAATAVDQVLTGPHDRALCLMRPPGHHALPDRAMGFCLFANAAVAARQAISVHELERVLIVDWDVHHGNGTQDIFYEDPRVTFFSAHRYPFYPGTGAAAETGQGRGLGTTFNLPLEFGIERSEYRSRFERLLSDAAKESRPELVLISAGFDGHAADPIGSLGLESEDFALLTDLVVQVANQYCDGRIVSLLEGGYNVDALTESTLAHMDRLTR